MARDKPAGAGLWWRVVVLAALLWVFLCSVNGIGAAFKAMKPFVESSFETFASGGAIVGLLAGMLATCIVQSSSTTTTLVVGLVASGSLTVGQAIPLIMGANIGTTITNTFVSIGSLSRREEFKRAFAAANIHDIFNVMAVIILLPIELMTGIIEKTAHWMADHIEGASSVAMPKGIKDHFKGVVKGVKGVLDDIFEGELGLNVALLSLSFIVLVIVLSLIVKTMRGPVLAHAEVFFDRFIGKSSIVAIIFGMVVTALVQSSSISTSLLIPLAGAGVISMKALFPVTLGCNIGTTVTALLAAVGLASDDHAANIAALTIALCHLFFNLYGIVILYVPVRMRNLTITLSEMLAEAVSRRRWLAPVYVISVFFVLPGVILAIQYREKVLNLVGLG